MAPRSLHNVVSVRLSHATLDRIDRVRHSWSTISDGRLSRASTTRMLIEAALDHEALVANATVEICGEILVELTIEEEPHANGAQALAPPGAWPLPWWDITNLRPLGVQNSSLRLEGQEPSIFSTGHFPPKGR